MCLAKFKEFFTPLNDVKCMQTVSSRVSSWWIKLSDKTWLLVLALLPLALFALPQH
jgi:hypothetical protein